MSACCNVASNRKTPLDRTWTIAFYGDLHVLGIEWVRRHDQY